MNQEILLQRIKNQDEQAFRELVETYQVRIKNTCLGFIHHREDAEDLAQEVFLDVFRYINNFRGDSSLSTWIYRIAVNKSLNFVRDKKRSIWSRMLTSDSEENHQATITSRLAGEPDPQKQLEDKESLAALHAVLNKLPENQRIAFVLHKFDDLPYKEIAEVMDVSLSSVESLIFRANKSLRKQLFKKFKKD